MKRISFCLLAAVFLLLSISCSNQNPVESNRWSDINQASQGRRWLVLLDDSSDSTLLASELKRKGEPVAHVYSHAVKGLAVHLSDESAARLRLDPRVKLVEPDLRMSIEKPDKGKKPPGGNNDPQPQVTPDGVARIGADQNPNTGAGVEVAVLDTGITLNHEDLEANILGSINFVNWKKNGNDDNFHGTHVAGIIAAIDNDRGVVGVAPDAKLWAVKVLDNQGNGWLSDVIAGMDWVTANADHIDVANMSFGGYGTSSTMHAAVQGMVNAGVTAVVSAGNSYSDTRFFIPASYSEVIAVSGIRPTNDTFYYDSNWGSVIDLTAPGVSIYSTLSGKKGLPLYGSLTGTSMASPHVAGSAALYIASHPGATPSQVMAALQAAGYIPPAGWPDDPLVSGDRPDPDGTTEALVIADTL